MTIDFRASQIQTNKLIASGTTGTSAKLLVYPLAAEGTPANQGVINSAIFNTSAIGTDVFVYFSGSTGSRGVNSSYGTAVFGGDMVISGTLKIGNCDFAVFSSSVASMTYESGNPTVDGFAFPGDNSTSARGDHVHNLPNGLVVTEQTVFSASVWTGVASTPSGGVASFPGSGVGRLVVNNPSDGVSYGFNGLEAFTNSTGPRIERPLIGAGVPGSLLVLRTRLVSFTGGANNIFGDAFGGIFIRDTAGTSFKRIITYKRDDIVAYGGTGGSSTLSASVPWNGTVWFELKIVNGTDLTMSMIAGATTTILGTSTLTFTPTFWGVYSGGGRSCDYTAEFDLPQQHLTFTISTAVAQLLDADSASDMRTILGVTAGAASWLDSSSKLATTASVAITSDGSYANAHGTDLNFYVSSSTGKVAAFVNEVHFSGNVVNDGDYGDIKKATLSTTNNTPTVLWQKSIPTNELRTIEIDILAKETDGSHQAHFKRQFLVFNDGSGAALLGSVYATLPDFDSGGGWGVNITTLTSYVNVYVTGNTGDNVSWVGRIMTITA